MFKLVQRLPCRVPCNAAQSRIPSTSRLFCSDKKSNENGSSKSDELELPEEPTNCCQSGCANCVYIEYATKLMENFQLGGDKAKKIILEKIKDPSMKAFLEMELRMKLKPK